jgi:hypothetical protein
VPRFFGVGVGVGVGVAEAVGVGVGVGVAEAVGVGVGVGVAEAVGVALGDGVDLTGIKTPLFQTNWYLPFIFLRITVNFSPAKIVVCPNFFAFMDGLWAGKAVEIGDKSTAIRLDKKPRRWIGFI